MDPATQLAIAEGGTIIALGIIAAVLAKARLLRGSGSIGPARKTTARQTAQEGK